MDNVMQAIADMEWMKQTHVHWAEHFEKYPDVEAEYVATGDWDDAKEHRRIIAKYDNVINLLHTLKK